MKGSGRIRMFHLPEQNREVHMKKYLVKEFGKTKDGRTVREYTLENQDGLSVSVLDYGCRIRTIYVPDRSGAAKNVCMGFAGMAPYEKGGCYGAIIGRFANRIKGAAFTLDGIEYRLPANDHENYIHGSFEHTLFQCEPYDDRLEFTYLSPAGEWGFPGNVLLSATYALTEDGALELTYKAMTDKATVINITNHCYFNLDGLPEDSAGVSADEANVYDHKLWIDADFYLEADSINMVTGKEISVDGNEFDFRTAKKIGEFKYDHNFCINGYDGSLKKCAEAVSEKTGIKMEVFTTQPGIQCYTGARKAVALETQHFPDGPHHPEWPGTTLRPGEVYIEKTIYRFA